MDCIVVPMTRPWAEIIATWQYPAPYFIYSMTPNAETINELLGGSYWAVLEQSTGELVGHCCVGVAAQVPGGVTVAAYEDGHALDIGLGMRPDLTGRGLGLGFLKTVVGFVAGEFAPRRLRLSVATFNQRAITLYERLGFVVEKVFLSPVANTDMEFRSMVLDLEA